LPGFCGLTWKVPTIRKRIWKIRRSILPPLTEGQTLDPAKSIAQGHTTQPPARFTEASLIKELEDRGIGRPSTYAAIIQTIQDRGYVWKKGIRPGTDVHGVCGHQPARAASG
jgi:DNA topoisomerase IA